MANGRFISYLRVSTLGQAASGLGVEAQRAAVDAYLNGGRWTLLQEFVETESGKKSDRPALAEAIKLAKRNKATLVIARLDRLSRNVHFISGLLESGVPFVACDLPSANKFTVQIMSCVAEQEAEAISKRTIAALQAAKARGVELGGRRGKLTAKKHWASVTAKGSEALSKQAAEFRQQMLPIIKEIGVTIGSANGIAAELNLRGETTRRGGQWTAIQVQRILGIA